MRKLVMVNHVHVHVRVGMLQRLETLRIDQDHLVNPTAAQVIGCFERQPIPV